MRLLATSMLTMIVLSAAPVAAGCEERPVDSIQQVKQRHEGTLMAVPGVVSIGIGADEQGRPVIVVGLERESPEARQRLPQRLEGYEVRARVVGPVRSQ